MLRKGKVNIYRASMTPSGQTTTLLIHSTYVSAYFQTRREVQQINKVMAQTEKGHGIGLLSAM